MELFRRVLPRGFYFRTFYPKPLLFPSVPVRTLGSVSWRITGPKLSPKASLKVTPPLPRPPSFATFSSLSTLSSSDRVWPKRPLPPPQFRILPLRPILINYRIWCHERLFVDATSPFVVFFPPTGRYDTQRPRLHVDLHAKQDFRPFFLLQYPSGGQSRHLPFPISLVCVFTVPPK